MLLLATLWYFYLNCQQSKIFIILDDDDHNEIEEYDEDEDTDRIDYDIATESTMSETIGS